MVDRTREGDELQEEFKVLGSTGNVSSGVGYETYWRKQNVGLHCNHRQNTILQL